MRVFGFFREACLVSPGYFHCLLTLPCHERLGVYGPFRVLWVSLFHPELNQALVKLPHFSQDGPGPAHP